MNVHFPLPSKGDKRALVRLLIKMKLVEPIHCIYLCEYAGVMEDSNLCFNPKVYSPNPKVKITCDLVISCSLKCKGRRRINNAT